MNNTILDTWDKRPLIISGPCSAETEEQVMATATELAKLNKVNLLRAGIWKPRTKPGMFEGIGIKGLAWLAAAKKSTGLPTTVEVATAKHVEDALQFDVDVLWIGARTTVNPFSVQEVADALRGVNIPVLIKNPINADLELWQGAVERVAKAGINNIGLIHRGFASYGTTEYRNAPMWHLAIEMKRRNANLPIICDPSHICGRRDILQTVAQTSINLDYDGIMLESHIDPDNAWSDAKQQITPAVFGEMLSNLQWRHENMEGATLNEMQQLRTQIDEVDGQLMQLLGARMKLADAIGQFKKDNNVTILQTNRWNEILEKAIERGSKLGLNKEFVLKYLDAVHLESIAHQNKIMNG
jgi:chorismate mutase